MELKKFNITFNEVNYTSARAEVWAESLDHAKRLAEDIDTGNLDWETYDGEVKDSDFDEYDICDDNENEKIINDCKDKNGVVISVGDMIEDGGHKVLVTSIGYDEVSDQIVLFDEIECTYDCNDVVKINLDNDLSDRDYWLKHGDCPKCRKGNTVTPQAGQFVCNDCGWKH